MNEELEQLQEIGAKKIHEQTHIPLQNVQALLDGSYESFTRVHFLGFVSILEREYKLELTEMKATGLTYFETDNKGSEETVGVFIAPKKKSKKSYFLLLALLIFIFAVAYKFSIPNENKIVKIEDSTQIEKLKEKVVQVTSKVDINNTKKLKIKELPKPTPVVLKPLKIITKSKVWFGYIDVATGKKYQKTFQGELELDPNKTWLFLFGHGYIQMYTDGKLQQFSSHPVCFYYKDGVLKSITREEFRNLNRGHKW